MKDLVTVNYKQDGDRSGTMRHLHLNVKSIRYIGKEANELEESEVLGLDDETYVEYLPPVTDDNAGNGTLLSSSDEKYHNDPIDVWYVRARQTVWYSL